MLERTTGLILRTRLLTETSLIVQWLTADAGRIATVAKGARRPKSPFRGKLDLCHRAEFTFRRSRASDLHLLNEVSLLETYPAIRVDWQRLNQAAYGVNLIEMTTEADTPLPEAWDLFGGYVARLDAVPPTPVSVLALELKHLAGLGLLPDLDRESLPEASRNLALGLLGSPWVTLGREIIPGDVFGPLNRFLNGFLIYHLGRLPRGRAEALGHGVA